MAKRHDAYVIEGPATIGNQFFRWGVEVPEGGFVVVCDDEYSSGGSGPSTIDGILYGSRERAEAAAKRGQRKRLLTVNKNGNSPGPN